MPRLPAPITNLAGRVEGSTVWCCAVPGDVALAFWLVVTQRIIQIVTHQLATRITFHCLSLTVACIMIRSSAFITGCRSWATTKTTPESSTVSASGSEPCPSASAKARSRLTWTVALVSGLVQLSKGRIRIHPRLDDRASHIGSTGPRQVLLH